MNSRQRFMATLRGEPADRVPVFPLLMFFAADRAGLTYRQFATDGRALAAAQLSIQERFGLDAITACSDAFRVSADLGGEMSYPESKPPHLTVPLITSAADLQRLGHPDPTEGRMGDRVLAVAEMGRAAAGRFAVLGWVDMPFAEACSLCGVAPFLTLLLDDPATAHRILAQVTEVVIAFGLAQVEAGADMIGAGDAAASLISAPLYDAFALPYEQRVCRAMHDAGSLVKLHICGQTSHLLQSMAKSGADLFNVDHLVPLDRARAAYACSGKCFKGNLDPVSQIMQASPNQCCEAARACLAMAEGARYMLSAGCEVPAETPDDVFLAFCEAPRLGPG